MCMDAGGRQTSPIDRLLVRLEVRPQHSNRGDATDDQNRRTHHHYHAHELLRFKP